MTRFAVQRILLVVPLLLILTLLVFLLVRASPGDPAATIAGPDATAESIAEIRTDLGLDRPLPVQYISYVTDLAKGDLGTSFTTRQPVTEMIGERLPRTLSIALLAMLLSIGLSIPLGVFAASRPGSRLDRAITAGSALAIAIPPFVFAAVLILLLALGSGALFPPGGYAPMSMGFGEWLRYATLPALALALVGLAELTRVLRSSMVEAFEQDYIRTARAKGLGRSVIVLKHAGKNAASVYLTVLGLQIGRVLGAAVIIEAMFNINGFSQLGYEAVLNRDLPTLQGVVLVSGAVVLLVNLAVDLSYGIVNPRIRAK
ncbi:ABC transporter permease [Rhodococcus sp. NPDC127530]|uniref:ABC transporter permease n=1 Tax=unclassified Rhodococcus (in: high G+C Gram-positive bacteria) TaxID=192944 RepID=UPI003638F1DF